MICFIVLTLLEISTTNTGTGFVPRPHSVLQQIMYSVLVCSSVLLQPGQFIGNRNLFLKFWRLEMLRSKC